MLSSIGFSFILKLCVMEERLVLDDQAVVCSLLTYSAAQILLENYKKRRGPKKEWVRKFLQTREKY